MPTVIDRHSVQQLVREGAQLVDVLGTKEYEAEHIPGAINIPLKKLDRATAKQLDARRPAITYCHDYQWDMSARAASRLATLGFTHFHRYQAGRADWFAAGLPREGKDAHVPRVADVAKRDVHTCRLDERVGDVRDRVGRGAGEPLIVVDADRVVLGLVNSAALAGDPTIPVEEVMDSAPLTFRPNIRAGEMPDYLKKQGVRHAIVTTSDGVLIGLLHLQPAHSSA